MANKSITLKGAGTSKTAAALRKDAKGRGQGGYLKRVPADGITVRFLTEPEGSEGWYKFYEHYDEDREDDRWVPCTEDCDGCARGLSRSKRWLANALDVEDGRVVPLVLPASLVTTLMRFYGKFNTIMDRDYELSKEGQNFDTEYGAIYLPPKKLRNADDYELLDLEATLIGIVSNALSDEDDEEEEEEAPRTRTRTATKKTVSRPLPKKTVNNKRVPVAKKALPKPTARKALSKRR